MSLDSDLFGRVLVTGSNGLLGSALCSLVEANPNSQLIALGRAQCDLTNTDETVSLFSSLKPTVVFHLAAKVAGIGGNTLYPAEMFFDNIMINSNVIEASRRAGVSKVVAVGSAAIYSDTISLPMKEADLWEGPPHSSEAAYGHAKRAMLAQLEAYKTQYGLDYAYAVLTNTFGPNDRFDEACGHVVPSLISKFHRAKAEKRSSIEVWGNGTPTRDFIYSYDVARALLLLASKFTGAINLATGSEVSIRDLVALMKEVSGYQGDIHWDVTRPNGQMLRKYDVSKLEALGFTPQLSLQDALAETYGWFEQNFSTSRC